MNKQEAIDIITGLYRIPVENGAYELAQEINKAIDMAIEALQDDWIPVSERLPENNGRYLVSYEGIIGMRTNILHYGVPSPLHTRGAEKCFYDTDREYGDIPYEDVVAWMPLPDAYEGGDTE